jgi:hypothetical protein
MSDKIVNFYDKLGIKGAVLPKTFKRHHMFNKSHTLCIGGTGSGKSNALINYISRSSGEFYKIIVCSFSTTDEPLYNMLEETGKIELISDIEEVPDLEEFDDEHKDKPKLIVFDDFLKLQKKDMKKIAKYLIAGRKFGFSVWLMAQDYVSVPKILVRNINYFVIFKMSDNVSLNNIIRNHNISDVDSSVIKAACNLCTPTFGNFVMIDMKTTNLDERFRHNFLGFLDLKNPQLL